MKGTVRRHYREQTSRTTGIQVWMDKLGYHGYWAFGQRPHQLFEPLWKPEEYSVKRPILYSDQTRHRFCQTLLVLTLRPSNKFKKNMFSVLPFWEKKEGGGSFCCLFLLKNGSKTPIFSTIFAVFGEQNDVRIRRRPFFIFLFERNMFILFYSALAYHASDVSRWQLQKFTICSQHFQKML